MAFGAIIALLASGIIGAIGSAITSTAQNNANIRSQQAINEANVQAQKDINEQNIAYSKEFAQNGISWKVNDLQNAGLNPVLAAGMSGSTSQPTAMSAPVQKAPMMDLSGISSAITAANNMLLTTYLMSQRNDIQAGRNDILSEKNNVLRDLYKRKAGMFESSAASMVNHSAKQVSRLRKEMEDAMTPQEKAKWTRMINELKALK